MQFVDDADDRVVDRHEPRVERQRCLAPSLEVDQLSRARHPGGVGGNERLALGGTVLVERLHPMHRDALESRVDAAGGQGSDDLPEKHQDTSSPSSSRMLVSAKRELEGEERSEEHTSELQSLTKIVCRL